MGCQIYGYVEYRTTDGEWVHAPLFTTCHDGKMEVVNVWRSGYEIYEYLREKSIYIANPTEKTNFFRMMNYTDADDMDETHVYAISLACLKYLALTYIPDDYDGAGDEDIIGKILPSMVKEIEAIMQFSELYYHSLDEVRYIWFASY